MLNILSTPFFCINLIIVNFGAFLIGRILRFVFSCMRLAAREKIISSLKRIWYISLAVGLGFLALCANFYQSKLNATPITGRQRIIIFNQELFENCPSANVTQADETFFGPVYAKTEEHHLRVFQITRRLVETNPELQPFKKWKINVVKDPLVQAAARRDGYIYVYDGMMKLANTQDQLAIVLSHEMAHHVLGHLIEELNYLLVLDVCSISCMAVIWLVIPSFADGLIAHLLFFLVITLMVDLPRNREREGEADNVGLMFASRACYDVREGSILYQKISIDQKMTGGIRTALLPDWVYTHPNSLKRAERMDFLQNQAEEWRNEKKCTALPEKDPRDDFKNRTYKTL